MPEPVAVILRVVLALFMAMMADRARANSLTFEFHPSGDRQEVVSCTIALRRDQFTAVEFQGTGYASLTPSRWSASEGEVQIFLDALQALLSGDPPSIPDLASFILPAVPFVVVVWDARMTDGVASGYYLQPGLDLPPPLLAVVEHLLADSRCAAFGGG